MKRFFVCVVFAALCSCSKTTDSKSKNSLTDTLVKTTASEVDYENLFKLESYLVSNVPEDAKLQIIDSTCAILVYPTDEQLEELKKNEGEENFYTAADDSNWYMAHALEKMDSAGVRYIEASGRFLQLKGVNKTWTLDVRKRNLLPWNLIFFKLNRDPQIIPTIDLTTEKVKEYFR
jgi:hypothetical protein